MRESSRPVPDVLSFSEISSGRSNCRVSNGDTIHYDDLSSCGHVQLYVQYLRCSLLSRFPPFLLCSLHTLRAKPTVFILSDTEIESLQSEFLGRPSRTASGQPVPRWKFIVPGKSALSAVDLSILAAVSRSATSVLQCAGSFQLQHRRYDLRTAKICSGTAFLVP